MPLIKSISGIRGTIGGAVGDSLTPLDIVHFTAAYAKFIRLSQSQNSSNKIFIGRDARISGFMVNNIVVGVLNSCGFDVVDLGLSTTPTVEVAVQLESAAGGIIITASHNPKNWNALKLLNSKGEFLSDRDGKIILDIVNQEDYSFNDINSIGKYQYDNSFNKRHIDEIINLPIVDVNLVKSANFKIVLDAVNSTGGIIIPELLQRMGVECIKLYCNPNGHFPHNPEPLPEHLSDISDLVVKSNADLGIVVDPDVDRLAFICEDGSMFGEEYTLVAIADYVLEKTPGNTVSNLSSTRALRDITNKHKCYYEPSAVGEVNVVEKMKEINAVIGGEGNGGIIYPSLHYGRDALVGIAIFLTQLAEKKITVSKLRSTYPNYYLVKKKMSIPSAFSLDDIFVKIIDKYKEYEITTIDGVKIDFSDGWIHLRKSNTEPIIRIYSESNDNDKAVYYYKQMENELKNIINVNK